MMSFLDLRMKPAYATVDRTDQFYRAHANGVSRSSIGGHKRKASQKSTSVSEVDHPFCADASLKMAVKLQESANDAYTSNKTTHTDEA
jgi:hypothetical protein